MKYILFQLFTSFSIFGIFTLYELKFPAAKEPFTKSRLKNLGVFVFNFFLIIYFPYQFTFHAVERLKKVFSIQLFHLPTSQNLALEGLKWFLFIFLMDFLCYVYHRFQHTRVLWFSHQLHHSDRYFNATTGERNHFFDKAIYPFFVGIPLILFIDFHLRYPMQLFLFVFFMRCFIHWNTKIDMRWWSWTLTGPQYHRIHHSIEPEHRNRNFAAFFPVIDVVFGTYYEPKKNEYPQVGLHQLDDEDGILMNLFRPFLVMNRSRRVFSRALRMKMNRKKVFISTEAKYRRN